jgi:alkylation response protein AidB-like acyl-CoA dehydrogenase
MIDFTFTEEQDLFRKAAREFAETKLAPHVPEMEETGSGWEPVIKELGEAEMMAITIPEEYDGLGLGYTIRMIALEEIARVSVATAMMMQVGGLGIDPIILFGTKDQKTKYLPGLASGERFATVAVTEPSGGSDPKGCHTSYKKQNGLRAATLPTKNKTAIMFSMVESASSPTPTLPILRLCLRTTRTIARHTPHSSLKREWMVSRQPMKKTR